MERKKKSKHKKHEQHEKENSINQLKSTLTLFHMLLCKFSVTFCYNMFYLQSGYASIPKFFEVPTTLET